MATSGTTTFNLDLNSLVEEAFERCGAEVRTGYDMRTARRSLNLMALEWANRGINLWTVEQGTIALTEGTATYDLPVDTIDLLETVVRTGTGANQADLAITRISFDTYALIPNKNSTGRPLEIWVNRRTGATNASSVVQYPQVTVWPVPDQDNYYTLVYWRLRRMEDAGNGVNTPDIPFRFLPVMVAGLAYHLSFKIPDAMQRTELLKAVYDEQWSMAADEDREKASLRIIPRRGFI